MRTRYFKSYAELFDVLHKDPLFTCNVVVNMEEEFITEKITYVNGKIHNSSGPASIVMYAKSGIVLSRYFLNDILYTSKEGWFEALSSEEKLNVVYKLDELP